MTLYREKTDTEGTGPVTLRGRAPAMKQNCVTPTMGLTREGGRYPELQ